MLQIPTESYDPGTGGESAGHCRTDFGILLATVRKIFEEDFPGLVECSSFGGGFDLILETERISFDFLTRGGKRFRPFVTLAAYRAMLGGATLGDSDLQGICDIPRHIRRAAIAIEAFHKASLVHDDIEDEDLFRYGKETLHRQHGTATAINVGDYLIGLGYRLITGDCGCHGSERVADILHRLMDAHVKLSLGQGAELAWRRQRDRALSSSDVLRIYSLKTSPAFEAALYTGVRLAGDARSFEPSIRAFSEHLGIGFQILNDLQDWVGDDDNKLIAGQDVLAMRPTLLLAMALETCGRAERRSIETMLEAGDRNERDGRELRTLFQSLGVLRKAQDLVEASRVRAREIADQMPHRELGQLLGYLAGTVLAALPERKKRRSDIAGAAAASVLGLDAESSLP